MKRRWTEEEETYLKANYDKMFLSVLAENIGRSYRAVRIKCIRMGLKLSDEEYRKRIIHSNMLRDYNNQSGKNNNNWKGGISINKSEYRILLDKKSPQKTKCRRKTSQLVRSGKIKKKPCIICSEIKVHAHHEDYNDPYKILWLCRIHHEDIHRGNLHIRSDLRN